MTETTILTTQIRTDSDDFDIRREFCGFQDKRLNDLRQFTSCIIDVKTCGTKDPFEKVTWVISHYDEAVRAFVTKRIQAWAKITQIAACIHAEDIIFHQQNLSDSSSSSIDGKVQQLVNSAKSSPSTSSVPNKNFKTSLHDHHFGNVPNAALVPQTEIRPRHQQRRRRNSSSSSSGIRRPVLFGKPSDCFFTRENKYPRNLHSPITTDGLSLIKPLNSSNEKEYSFDLNKISNNDEDDNTDFEEEAKWSNLLSDTSDFECNSYPLMADIFLVSQLRDILINSNISSDDDIEYIQSILSPSLSITGHEQTKTLNKKRIWFCRLMLNSKIILSNGIHRSKERAQKLAYKKMIELITNEQGVVPKIISNGRCKVVLRKCQPLKNLDETTTIDSIADTTIDTY